MKNNTYLVKAFGLSAANIMLVAVGVILMPTMAWAVAWGIACFVLHFGLLVTLGYFELQAQLAADALEFRRMFAASKEPK